MTTRDRFVVVKMPEPTEPQRCRCGRTYATRDQRIYDNAVHEYLCVDCMCALADLTVEELLDIAEAESV